MDFSVTILGANSAVPAHGRNQTCQVVTLGNQLYLVDCGESTQIQLRKYKVKFSKINNIFISHLHGDHYLGLMGVISTFHLNRRKDPLTIFGPKGLDEIIIAHLKHGNTKLNYPLKFIPTDPDKKSLLVDDNTHQVYSFPLKHRLPCTGFYFIEKPKPRNLVKEKLKDQKLSLEAIETLKSGKDFLDEEGNVLYPVEEFTYPPAPLRKYAFCSDTIYDPELVPFIKGVDLLYHEATFMNDEAVRARETFHSTAAQAGAIARAGKVKKLLLGHYSTRYSDLSPLLLEAQDIFPNSFLSVEGESYCVSE
ncbi:ribonuclease Z [Echinicola jeungdonensis]|uniref:Ribonuclease Z n=1 Tax=Echinicola jeungdonensis TaxID=709343 RepID=A0ABV5J5T3_9BACT|nr:ribonuclease Z [Echinicola jeungdonensis]MDN3670996.1 ribonuclease Z [Echinicola jeungdonensis]